jgi:integrase
MGGRDETQAHRFQVSKTHSSRRGYLLPEGGYACDLEMLERNPVPAFRETLRRRAGTKRAREESQAGRTVRPIERTEDLEALLESARVEGAFPYVLVLLCVGAGLRPGEALGLRWGAIRRTSESASGGGS